MQTHFKHNTNIIETTTIHPNIGRIIQTTLLPMQRIHKEDIHMLQYHVNYILHNPIIIPYYLEIWPVSYKCLVSFSGQGKVHCNIIKRTV